MVIAMVNRVPKYLSQLRMVGPNLVDVVSIKNLHFSHVLNV